MSQKYPISLFCLLFFACFNFLYSWVYRKSHTNYGNMKILRVSLKPVPWPPLILFYRVGHACPMDFRCGPKLNIDARNFFWMIDRNLISEWRHHNIICKSQLDQWFWLYLCEVSRSMCQNVAKELVFEWRPICYVENDVSTNSYLFPFKSYGRYNFGPISEWFSLFWCQNDDVIMTSSSCSWQSIDYWKVGPCYHEIVNS